MRKAHVQHAAGPRSEEGVAVSLGASTFSMVFGGCMLLLGILAHTGINRTGHFMRLYTTGVPDLALFYLGIFFFSLPVALLLMDVLPPILTALLGFAVLGNLFVGVIGFLWLPRFMRPRWMDDRDRAGRESRRLRRQR